MLLLSLLVTTQIQASFLGGEAKRRQVEGQVQTVDQQLKLALSQEALWDRFVVQWGPVAKLPTDRQIGVAAALREPLEKLVPLTEESDAATLLWAAATYELGGEVPPERLWRLANSQQRSNRLLAKLYRGEALAPGEVAEIEKGLPRHAFAERLAIVHARERAGLPSHHEALLDTNRFLAAYLIILCGLGGGLIVWLVYLIVRATGGMRPEGPPLASITPAEADSLALRTTLLILVLVGVPTLVGLLPGLGVGGRPTTWGGVASGIVTFGLYAWVLRMPLAGRRVSLAEFGLSTRHLGRHLGLGFLGMLATLPIFVGAFLLSQKLFAGLPQFQHEVLGAMDADPLRLLVLYTMVAIYAPLTEEISLRGSMLPALRRISGRPWVAIVVTSLVFGALHSTGIPTWLPLGAIGAMMALMTYQTGSLVPAIALHATYNFGVFTLALLMR